MEVQHPEVDQAGDGPGKGHPEFPCHEDREGGLPAPHGEQVVEEVVQKDKPEGTEESSRCGRMEIDVDPNGPDRVTTQHQAKGLRRGAPGGWPSRGPEEPPSRWRSATRATRPIRKPDAEGPRQ